jgi:hypothetical protein
LDAVSVLVTWLHPQSFSARLLKHPADFSRAVAEMGIQVFVGKKKQVKTSKEPKLTSMVRDIHGRMYGRPLTGNFFGSPQGFGKFSLHHPGIYT